MASIIKKTLIALVALVILYVGYAYFLKPAPEQTDLATTVSISDADSADIIRLLDQISSVHIDKSFFTGAPYQSLRDLGTDIGSEPYGRPDPFAPVGFDSGTIPSSPSPRSSTTPPRLPL